MSDFFIRRGVAAVAVHAGSSSAPRATSLQRLDAGEIEVVFAVDMFNEGVDVPSIDTVLMLRPTESTVIWLQQLGRGLRRSAQKDRLIVIDYIGNHRIFLTKVRAIASVFGANVSSHGRIRELLELIGQDQIALPIGCEVTYDLAAINILSALVKPTSTENALEEFYVEFRERHGIRPTAVEVFHSGNNPRSSSERSWFAFVQRMDGLDQREAATWTQHRELLSELETTELTRSYKLVVLTALMEEGVLRPRLTFGELAERVTKNASRMHRVQQNFSVDLTDRAALKSLLRKHPIDALTKLCDSEKRPYFTVDADTFGFATSPSSPELFVELFREVLDWRLADYLSRNGEHSGPTSLMCRVALTTSGQPMLFLPTSSTMGKLAEGPLDVIVGDEPMQATIAKVAINVVRRRDDSSNYMPSLLRDWFGAAAGQPGKGHRVRLQYVDQAWRMEPIGIDASGDEQTGLRWGERYLREKIPPAFGLTFDQATWNAGFVLKSPHVFLLVTLEKGGMMEEHRYADRFISAEEFSWQSQNRTRQQSKHGEIIRNHRALKHHVHLLVRKTKKIGSRPAPFIYCGEVDFVAWSGEMPITVNWRLREPLHRALLGQLTG